METSTAHAIHKLSTEMDRVADKVLQARFGISYNRFYFLFILDGNSHATQHSLATALGFSDAAISHTANWAAQEGLVTITTDPTHKRRRSVSLTTKGKTVLQECLRILDECFESVVAEAGINEAAYRTITQKLIQTLQTKMKEDQ